MPEQLIKAIGAFAALIGLLTGLGTVIGWIASESFVETGDQALQLAGAVFIVGFWLVGAAVFARDESDSLRHRVFWTSAALLFAVGGVIRAVEKSEHDSLLFWLGCVAVLFAVVFLTARALIWRQAYQAGRKDCPDCAETVKTQAKVCRYCGYRFESSAG